MRKALGAKDAEALTPQELEGWLSKHCDAEATFNRYKAVISLAYRQGIRNKRVSVNPARLIPQRKEPKGRLRFLTRDEFSKLRDVIEVRFPDHLAEFVFAVHTGMRLSEQYTVEVSQFDQTRRAIDLDRTKNGDARTVHLNSEALAAIKSVLRPRQKRAERAFPHEDRSGIYKDRKFERFD